MRRTTVVNKGNDHPEGEGTVHIVSGGGGCGLTFVESAPWQATNAYTHHFCALTATGDSLEMVVRKPDGAVIDRVVFRTSSTAVKRVSIGTPSRKGSREPRAVGSGNSSLLDVGGALTSNSSVLFYSVDGRRIAGGAAPAQQRVGLGNVMARGLYIVVVKTGGARVMSILAVP